MSISKVSKQLIEAAASVLQEAATYKSISKSTHKVSSPDKLIDTLETELGVDLSPLDTFERKVLFGDFSKGYPISAAVIGSKEARALKKDGYFDVVYRDIKNKKGQEIYLFVKKPRVSDDPEEFIMDFDEEHGTAAEMWLGKKKTLELMNLANANKKLKGVSVEIEDSKLNKEQIISKWESKGYKLFADDENIETLQFIFVK